ncbi:MAG: Hint domain-containing protein [Arenibacterium sp.]
MEPKEFGATASLHAAPTVTAHFLDLPPEAHVWTKTGEQQVSCLRAGAYIVSRNAGYAKLRALQRQSAMVELVEIAPGSFGSHRPSRPSFFAASQTVLVRNWRAPLLFGMPQATCALHQLCEGEFIRHIGMRTCPLARLSFDAPTVLYVNGMELCTAPLIDTSPIAA